MEGEIQKRMDFKDVEIDLQILESYWVWNTEKWNFWKDPGLGKKVSLVFDM